MPRAEVVPDLVRKVEKAKSIHGTRFLSVLIPCLDGWGLPDDAGLTAARYAVECGAFPLYEIEDGDIIHYHNGFGQFVRCEVVDGGAVPIALVNGVRADGVVADRFGWKQRDLASWTPDGQPHYGYHANQVVTGERPQGSRECWQPSDVWENSSRLLDEWEDPAFAEPLSIRLPERTEDEIRAHEARYNANLIVRALSDSSKPIDLDTVDTVAKLVQNLYDNLVD